VIGAGALILAIANGGAKAPPSRRVACGFILLTLATAAMTGLGRTGAADPYNVPLRYALTVAPLHVGLLMLALPGLGRLWRGHRRLVEGVALGALAVLLVHDAAFGAKTVEASDVIRETVVDFHAGVRTSRMLTLIYPNLDYAQAMSARMARDGLYQHELHLKPRPRPDPAAKPV
jgi:hypothetical protein